MILARPPFDETALSGLAAAAAGEVSGGGVRAPARRARDTLLAARLHSASLPLAGILVLFALRDVIFGQAHLAALLLFKLIQFAVIAVLYRIAYSPTWRARALPLAIAGGLVLCATTAASNVLRGEVQTTAMLFVGVVICMSTLLPWGARAQSLAVAVASATLALNAYAVHGDFDPIFSYPAATVLLVFAISIYIAAVLERFQNVVDEGITALRDSEGRYRTLVENTGDVICQLDARGRYSYVGANCLAVFGYEAAQLIGRRPLDLVHPDDLLVGLDALRQRRRGQVMLRVQHGGGGWRWVEISSNVYDTPDGEIGAVLVARDVTERRLAEVGLAQSQANLTALIDNTDDAVWSVDHELRMVAFNATAQREYRLYCDGEMHTGQRAGERLGDVERAYWDGLYRRALGGERFVTEQHDEHGAAPRDYLLSFNPIMDGGAVSGVAVFSREITARKRAEETLRRSETRYRLVAQAANDAIWDWDLTTQRVDWNDHIQTLFGWRPEEVEPDSVWWAAHIHPDDAIRVHDSICAVIEGGGQAWRDEYRFRCRDGSYAVVDDRGYVVRGAAGEPQRMIGAMTDITMRRQAEEALRRSEHQFRSLIERGSDLISIVDGDGIMRYASPSHWTVLGYKPEDLVGRSSIDHVHPDDLAGLARDAIAIGDAPVEFRFRHADGGWRVLESHLNNLSDDPAVGGQVVNSRDITDRKRAEADLQRAKEAAEAASRVKSQFVANMSHEIRTPMNGILGMTELALDTELDAEQREYLETVRASGEWLLTLLNDVLDFSKIEAGRVALDPTEFDLRAMLAETLRILTPRAHGKGLALVSTVDDDVPAVVVGDPDRLRQVLVNLIGNAIKFTARGDVALHVSCAAPAGAPLVLRVAVRDSGIGIAPDQQKAIFDAFVQADGSATREYGGTGLGLAICRELVSLMGGEIGVKSTPGLGSTFHFTARVGTVQAGRAPRPAAAVPAPLPSPHGPLRILLAEDNVVNQRLAVRLLEKRGHSVAVAVNGTAVLAAVECERFDVVLMDVQMPGMDGLEATAEIRRREREAGAVRLPIIAMTAHAMSGDRERCLGAGMDGYVAKPIQTAALLGAIDAVFGAAPVPAPPRAVAANG